MEDDRAPARQRRLVTIGGALGVLLLAVAVAVQLGSGPAITLPAPPAGPALPSVPSLPTLPSLPSDLPTDLPTGFPTAFPSGYPTGLPTDLPELPSFPDLGGGG